MTEKDMYSFEPVSTTAPVEAAVVIPTDTEEAGERPSDTAIMVGCGAIGMCIGGPFLALLTALGGRWSADKKNPFGESTRTIGRITASAGKKAQDEHLWCKMKAAVSSVFKRNNRCDCQSCKNQASCNVN